jgi:hypothetical protein
MKEQRRLLSVNIMSEVFPIGDSFPNESPPFHGACNVEEISKIKDRNARELALGMVDLCMRLQQRSLSLAKEGDIVPLQAPVEPDLVQHVVGDSFGINPENIHILNIRDTGKLTLPEAIMADGKTMDTLRNFVSQPGQKTLISPFAVDDGIQRLAKELNVGYGQEWPHEPHQVIPDGKVWTYPRPEAKWRLWQANSKARNYEYAKAIDRTWVPEGNTANSYQDAGKQVGEMLFDNGYEEVGVKADINVDGMGNLRFGVEEKDKMVVTYEAEKETFRVDENNREGVARLVEDQCRKRGIFINNEHPATVQKWEKFLFGLTPSVEVYIPPRESGKAPFVINECTQLIENGAFVGSINPDPLTGDMNRLNEIPNEYWKNLGTSKEDFILHHRRGYLAAWEKQRRWALEFSRRKQTEGEVGHRDFDFGVVIDEDQYNPKLCESNARRTGTWVADTVGRRLQGSQYLRKSYVMTVDNTKGPSLDTNFRTVHSTFAKTGGLFVPETKTGIILNGHIRDGGNSRMLTTITGARMSDVWRNYKLTQDVVSWR